MPRLLERVWNTGRLGVWARRDPGIAYRDREELARVQDRRVRALVDHAWRETAYYREWLKAAGAEPGDIRGAADLARLPVIDKIVLTRHPERFEAESLKGKDGITLHSSGTSGYRRHLRHDARAVVQALAAGRRQRLALAEYVGRESGYREAVFNREGSVGAQLRAFFETRTWVPRGVELRRRLFSPVLPFAELAAGVDEFEPEVIRGYGSHLGAFFQWLAESGRRFHKPRAIVYGADAMPPAQRRLIEEELGIPVLSTYQAVEALRIGFECPARAGFHISVDQVVVRVRDKGPGERGEMVLTNLWNYATPVINYQLGDLVTLSDGACPCGRTLPLLTSIDGRADDLVARPDGTRVHALALLAPLQKAPGVMQVQVEQRGVDDFLLRVIWRQGEARDEEELKVRVKQVLGAAAAVEVVEVAEIATTSAGKVKSLISRLERR
jgi:phenylacetate-CoA ligase